jgi:hypothetical protein
MIFSTLLFALFVLFCNCTESPIPEDDIFSVKAPSEKSHKGKGLKESTSLESIPGTGTKTQNPLAQSVPSLKLIPLHLTPKKPSPVYSPIYKSPRGGSDGLIPDGNDKCNEIRVPSAKEIIGSETTDKSQITKPPRVSAPDGTPDSIYFNTECSFFFQWGEWGWLSLPISVIIIMLILKAHGG